MARRLGRDEIKARLRAASPAMLPSLLACDFAHLEREVREVEAAGVPALHLDVMDGHFVPNLSIGVPIVEAVRRITDLPLDVHLMISEPARVRGAVPQGGGRFADDPRRGGRRSAAGAGSRFARSGRWPGLALNPPTPLSAIEASLPHCDLVLVMSVMPGFGGQKFDDVALGKLRELARAAELRCAVGSRWRGGSGNGRAVCRSRRRVVCGGDGDFQDGRLRRHDSAAAFARRLPRRQHFKSNRQ